MKRDPNGKYTQEFRLEAVKLVTDGGLRIPETGRRLSLAPSTLSNWVKAYKTGKLEELGKNHQQMSDKEMELVRLKRELAKVKVGINDLVSTIDIRPQTKLTLFPAFRQSMSN